MDNMTFYLGIDLVTQKNRKVTQKVVFFESKVHNSPAPPIKFDYLFCSNILQSSMIIITII